MLERPRAGVCLGGGYESLTPPAYVEVVEATCARLGLATSSVALESFIPRHVGLGSGTQFALSIALGGEILSGGDEKLAGPKLWQRAGRGATSKVGCAGFDKGGLILDLGRPASAKTALGPSRFAGLERTHDRTLRFDFPEWDILVVIPRGWEHVFGENERLLFAAFSQSDDRVALETAFIQERRLLPAARERDLLAFDAAMRATRAIGFKLREIEHRGEPLAALIADLEAHGLSAVTLSSWGPAVIGFTAGMDEIERARVAKRVSTSHDADVFWTRADNQGRRVEIICD